MKTTDWYTRTLLTLLVALLGYVAVELRTLNTYQAALTSFSQLAEPQARQASPFRPTTVAMRQPNTSLLPPAEPIEVRIVGYKYNGEIKNLGNNYSSHSHGLPVMIVK